MEKTIVSFMSDALISSEEQLNFIDAQFKCDATPGDIGTKIKTVAMTIRNNIIDNLDCCTTALDVIRKVIEICQKIEPGNEVSRFISDFFEQMHHYLFIISPECIQFLCLNKKKINVPNECVVIDEEDDTMTSSENKKVNNALISSHIWVKAMDYSVNSLNGNNEYDGYQAYFYRGLIATLQNAILLLEKCDLHNNNEINDMIMLTNIIENLSSSEITIRSEILFMNSKSNPALQVLSTSFRSLVEAIKQ